MLKNLIKTLISYKFNLGKNDSEKGFHLLEIIDPSKTFEEFLRPNLVRDVKNQFSNIFDTSFSEQEEVVSIVNSLKTKLRSSNKAPFPDIVDRLISANKEAKFEIDPEKIEILEDTFPEEVKRLKELKKQTIEFNERSRKGDLLNTALSEFETNLTKNNVFYIAFGMGDNLAKWAGPYAVTLSFAAMRVTADNLRRIELGFVPTQGPLINTEDMWHQPVFFDLQGYGIKAEGRSDLIDVTKIGSKSQRKRAETEFNRLLDLSGLSVSPFARVPTIKGIGRALSNIIGTRRFETKTKVTAQTIQNELNKSDAISSFINLIDFHSIIVQCLERYLKKIGGTENVIVLLPNINLERQLQFSKSFIKNVERDKRFSAEYRPPAKQRPWIDQLRNPSTAVKIRKRLDDTVEAFIKDSLEDLGIRCGKPRKQKDMVFAHHVQNVQKADPAAVAPFVAILESNYIKDSIIDPKKKKKNAIPNWQTPLDKVTEAIGRANNLDEQSTVYMETNMKVVEIWAKEIPSKVTRQDQPVLIFGYDKWIEKYLYGLYQDVQDGNMSLHTDDQKLFLNQAMWDLVKLEVEGDKKDLLSTPLGDFFNLPTNFGPEGFDEFALKELVEKVEYNIPVFRANTQNPNVLEIDLEYEGTYLGQALKAGMNSAINFFPALSNADRFALQKNYALNHDWFDLVVSMRQNKINQEDAIQGLKKKFNLTPASNEEVAKYVQGVYALQSLDPAQPIITVHEDDGANPLSIQLMVLQHILPKKATLSIKTLPLFQLSNLYFLGFGCLLLAQQPQIIGAELKRGAVDSFYSGYHIIRGMEHTISKTDVSSRFVIVKNLDALSTKDLGIEKEKIEIEAGK
jgi:hypothetical protein